MLVFKKPSMVSKLSAAEKTAIRITMYYMTNLEEK
jgi:hypothetical protein